MGFIKLHAAGILITFDDILSQRRRRRVVGVATEEVAGVAD